MQRACHEKPDTSEPVKSDIDVIILDVNVNDPGYKNFQCLTADKKIDRFVNLIHESMKIFNAAESKKKTLKIFAWREHAISDPNSLFCDNKTRKLLKEKMRELIKIYPDICIISGTVSTKKHFSQFTAEHISDIKEAYNHPQLQLKIKNAIIDNIKIDDKINTTKGHLDQINNLDLSKEVDVVRNSAHVFHVNNVDNAIIVDRRDKVIPFHELMEMSTKTMLVNAIFRPGKGKTADPLIEVTHPVTKKKVIIGLEICMEHSSSYLKTVLRNNIDNMKEPDIHFVLSDSTKIKTENICAAHLIHVDSYQTYTAFIRDKYSTHSNISCYKVNGLNSAFSLETQIPLKKSLCKGYKYDVLVYFDTILKEFRKREDAFGIQLFTLLKEYKIKLIEISKDNITDFTAILEELKNELGQLHDNYLAEFKKLDNTSVFSFSFFLDYQKKKLIENACIDLNALTNSIHPLNHFIELSKANKSRIITGIKM